MFPNPGHALTLVDVITVSGSPVVPVCAITRNNSDAHTVHVPPTSAVRAVVPFRLLTIVPGLITILWPVVPKALGRHIDSTNARYAWVVTLPSLNTATTLVSADTIDGSPAKRGINRAPIRPTSAVRAVTPFPLLTIVPVPATMLWPIIPCGTYVRPFKAPE